MKILKLEVKDISYMDYLKFRTEVEWKKFLISVVVIYVFIFLDLKKKAPSVSIGRAFVEFSLASLLAAVSINLFVYIVIYYIKYRRALKESPAIKAQMGDKIIKNFNIFGESGKISSRKYTDFIKIYKKRTAYYFKITNGIAFFIPSRHLLPEEV